MASAFARSLRWRVQLPAALSQPSKRHGAQESLRSWSRVRTKSGKNWAGSHSTQSSSRSLRAHGAGCKRIRMDMPLLRNSRFNGPPDTTATQEIEPTHGRVGADLSASDATALARAGGVYRFREAAGV